MADTWLGRFRIDGTNWEGREWRLAPSLVTLARQISELHPDSEPGDGTVASQRHDEVSPFSDHRPRPFSGPGIVRAIDAGESEDDDPMVASLVVSRDPRIAYIIYEGKIWRSYDKPGIPAWQGAPYSGASPHSHHFHLSTLRSTTADNDTRPWQIGGNMSDHSHQPPRSDLPREWADGTWEEWVAASGTNSGTRTHDFYREDLGWVYSRIIAPMERRIASLEAKLDQLTTGQLEIETEKVEVVRSVRVRR